MPSQAHWFCQGCGTFDGPISNPFCDVCANGRKVEWLVPVKTAADWLRHVDRLDEIPGAKVGMPDVNPLWDAGVALEARFGGARGQAPPPRPEDVQPLSGDVFISERRGG